MLLALVGQLPLAKCPFSDAEKGRFWFPGFSVAIVPSTSLLQQYSLIFCHNFVNLSQLCSRKPLPVGGAAKFDRMSKQPQPPVYSGMPDPSNRGRAKRPAVHLSLRHSFKPLGKLRLECPPMLPSPLDFHKGAGFSPTGSKPAPFAFWSCAVGLSLPFSALLSLTHLSTAS